MARQGKVGFATPQSPLVLSNPPPHPTPPAAVSLFILLRRRWVGPSKKAI